MFQIAIIPNNTDANLSLSFKTKDAANGALAYIRQCLTNQSMVDQMDDFGYVLIMDAADIAYALFIDVEQSQFCQYQKNLSMAKAAKKLVEQCDQDELELMGMASSSNQRPKIIQ